MVSTRGYYVNNQWINLCAWDRLSLLVIVYMIWSHDYHVIWQVWAQKSGMMHNPPDDYAWHDK